MVGNTVIIIVGPTASGKTALALQLARYFKTDIISADSRQCFRELDIGVAKPTPQELLAAKHYFINSHSIHDTVNAQVFEGYALQAASEIFIRSNYAIMVGGTGLYIKAFCDGLDAIPMVEEGIRQNILQQYNEKGMAWLQQQVRQNDPEFWAVGETQNPQRLMRALEVKISSGRSIVAFRNKQPAPRPFKTIKLGLSLPRAVLYNNINRRVDDMMQSGLLQEAEELLPFRNINALQTVGYKELFNFFDGKYPLNAAVEEIKKNTRHYAKRQLTWFGKDAAINWKSSWAADSVNLLLGEPSEHHSKF